MGDDVLEGVGTGMAQVGVAVIVGLEEIADRAVEAEGLEFADGDGGEEAHARGVVDVVVTNEGSTLTLSRGFVYVPAPVGTSIYTLTACRLIDTRNAAGPQGGPPLNGGGAERVFPISGSCGVPSDAKAVSVNVTLAEVTGTGFLRIYPGDGIPSDATAIEFVPGKNRANNAMVYLATDGTGTFAVKNEAPAGTTVHVIVDVTGYYR